MLKLTYSKHNQFDRDDFSNSHQGTVKMSLLNTKNGIDWLTQFEEEDQKIAALLVNSLQLISQDEFQHGIMELVEDIMSKEENPIALYCIRETDDDEHYFDPKSKAKKPIAIRAGHDVGSEGRLANIITSLSRRHGTKCLNHPSLSILKNRRCHTIVLLDDLSGSGERVECFIKSFYNHPTIKSWYSYKLINIYVVCYAASTRTEEVLKKILRRSPTLRYQRRPTSGPSRWSGDDLEVISWLCGKYGPLTQEPSMEFGYQNTMGTMVFAHGCPDNVPAILWGKSRKWNGLFPNRAIPIEFVPLFGVAAELARRNQQQFILGKAQFRESGRTFWPDLELRNSLLVMAAMKEGHREIHLIAEAVDLDKQETQRIVAFCKKEGLITANLRFTSKGERFFRRCRTADSINITEVRLDNSFYFPHRSN